VDELVAEADRSIDECLAEVLSPGEPVALVNFANHANVGDAALWLSQLQILARTGHRVRYRSSWSAYEPVALARAHPDGAILINGGGNLGDVYMNQQGVRERVIVDFPDRRIVQLPQSTWFRTDDGLTRFARLLAGHDDVHLLLRDHQSLAFAQKHFDVSSMFCADTVLTLGVCERSRAPTTDIVALMRGDPEASGDQISPDMGIDIVDWSSPMPAESAMPLQLRPVARLNRVLNARCRHEPRAGRRWGRVLAQTYGPMARYWTERGRWAVSGARVVVTDRLHAHVLCLQAGVPHVLLDNAYGKVRAYYEASTAGCPLVVWADSADEAVEEARRMLR
jgi:exopolysaccharide biosynthesis predicted pyruvyltransferase EpsI